MISFDDIFQTLVPKDKKFMPLFTKASANVLEAAHVFHRAIHGDSVTRLNLFKEVSILERQADEFTHVIVSEASTNFIVPFDREDIQLLASALDEVIDYMNGCSKRIELYKVHSIDQSMLTLSDIILSACKELDWMINNMSHLKYTVEMRECIARIAELEKQSDGIFDDLVGNLFKHETNALQILKMKEVYSFFSETTDRVEDAARVIENILVKFS